MLDQTPNSNLVQLYCPISGQRFTVTTTTTTRRREYPRYDAYDELYDYYSRYEYEHCHGRDYEVVNVHYSKRRVKRENLFYRIRDY